MRAPDRLPANPAGTTGMLLKERCCLESKLSLTAPSRPKNGDAWQSFCLPCLHYTLATCKHLCKGRLWQQVTGGAPGKHPEPAAIQPTPVTPHTWGNVEAAAPLGDAGVLEAAQVLVVVQHHRSALVGHAKFVGVHRHAGHPRNGKVKGRDGVPQLAGKGEHKAAQAGVHVAQHAGSLSHLQQTAQCA